MHTLSSTADSNDARIWSSEMVPVDCVLVTPVEVGYGGYAEAVIAPGVGGYGGYAPE